MNPSTCLTELLDRKKVVKNHNNYMMDRVLTIFEYTQLPETIPREELERALLYDGLGFFKKITRDDVIPTFAADWVDGVYLLSGSIGGIHDIYNRPMQFIPRSPVLKVLEPMSIRYDGVLIKNDSNLMGLYPIISEYGDLITESLISLLNNIILSRAAFVMTGSTQGDEVSLNEWIKKLIHGDIGSVISKTAQFFEGVKVQPGYTGTSNTFTQLIETIQYLKASERHELGIDANFNMKREALGSSETALNSPYLKLLIYDMLNCREEAIRRLNDYYNLSVGVKISPLWQEALNEEVYVNREDSNSSPVSENDSFKS